MAVSRDKPSHDALRLEQQDRAGLAKMLIDSLDPATDEEVEEAWMREIDRRAAELEAGTAETIPWVNGHSGIETEPKGWN